MLKVSLLCLFIWFAFFVVGSPIPTNNDPVLDNGEKQRTATAVSPGPKYSQSDRKDLNRREEDTSWNPFDSIRDIGPLARYIPDEKWFKKAGKRIQDFAPLIATVGHHSFLPNKLQSTVEEATNRLEESKHYWEVEGANRPDFNKPVETIEQMKREVDCAENLQLVYELYGVNFVWSAIRHLDGQLTEQALGDIFEVNLRNFAPHVQNDENGFGNFLSPHLELIKTNCKDKTDIYNKERAWVLNQN